MKILVLLSISLLTPLSFATGITYECGSCRSDSRYVFCYKYSINRIIIRSSDVDDIEVISLAPSRNGECRRSSFSGPSSEFQHRDRLAKRECQRNKLYDIRCR